VLLVSVSPAAGAQISGEGVLLNLEIEALASGDSSLAFDLSNVHLVPADGRATVLQLAPATLTVKPAPAPSPKPASETSSNVPAVLPETQLSRQAEAASAGLGTGIAALQEVTSRSYVVQRHDNLWKIATEHGVTMEALRQVNQLRSNVLSVGRELIIP
jgi:LysM repeat protein